MEQLLTPRSGAIQTTGISFICRPPFLVFDGFESFDVPKCRCDNCRPDCSAIVDDDDYQPNDDLDLDSEQSTEEVEIATDISEATLKEIESKIKDLVKIYLGNDEKRWTNCLLYKWSLSDCVTGCHNGEIEDKVLQSPGKKLFNFHPHIKRFSAFTIFEMVYRMEYASFNRPFRDFEELFDKVEWLAGHTHESCQPPYIDKFGRVAIYDTALRIGFHLKKNPRKPFGNDNKNRVLPLKYVYLHAGAMQGARALATLGVLKKKPNANGKIKLELKELTKIFPSYIIEKLEPYQIEDFLCVMHKALERLAKKYKSQII
jgi:hypothetical protein